MTRPLTLAGAALLAVTACSAPAPPETASTPAPASPAATPQALAVHVQVPEEPEAAVEAWAQALRSAIVSGQGGLTLAATPEEAGAVVLIGTVEKGAEGGPAPAGEGELYVMRFALVVDDKARELSVVYRGEARPQAEALARNLRRVAAEVATSGASPGSEEASAPHPPEEPADVEDEG